MGAVDVVPFIPIQGIEMKEAVQVAREFGMELGNKGISVYFYEEAAMIPERKELPAIRKGEYEGLKEKLRDINWIPDEGPLAFNPKSGVTVVGARFPLVAYNVNLRTRDLNIAKEIAKRVRFKDGGFPCVRAMGVNLEDKGLVQVSMNLTNYLVTNMPTVMNLSGRKRIKGGLRLRNPRSLDSFP